MLQIGKLPDYGLVIAATLAGSDSLTKTREVAADAGIPLPTVRRLLKHLVDAGLVESFRGSRGGYQLARSPGDISIGEIIEAVSGPIGLTACSRVTEKGGCSLERNCPLAAGWCRLNAQFVASLHDVSLLEMTAPKT